MKPRTVYEAGAERRAEAATWEREADKAAAERAALVALLTAHPEIGVLCRRGRAVYYVNAPTYRESENPRDLVNLTPEDA